jgi:hypothetical protein
MSLVSELLFQVQCMNHVLCCNPAALAVQAQWFEQMRIPLLFGSAGFYVSTAIINACIDWEAAGSVMQEVNDLLVTARQQKRGKHERDQRIAEAVAWFRRHAPTIRYLPERGAYSFPEGVVDGAVCLVQAS